MKKLVSKILSIKFAMLILLIVLVAIATATFIENSFDTNTAKLLIYNSKLFGFTLVLLAVIYIAIVIKQKLFVRYKIPQLVLHISFVFMIIGGVISHFFSFEADMHVLENESTNKLYTSEPYINIRILNNNTQYSSTKPIIISQIENNNFFIDFNLKEKGKINIKYQNYIRTKTTIDTLIIDISHNGETQNLHLPYDNTRYIQKYIKSSFNDLQYEISYGPKSIELPFSLKLDKFILSKYPGSHLASALECDISIIDDNKKENYIISKNRVLDYKEYRFFLISNDSDEKAVILSVNNDYFGTKITYFGYFLLIFGSFLIFFSKNSRFSQLNKKIKELRNRRKSLFLTLVFLLSFNSIAVSENFISKNHSEKFGHLIVQNYEGRFYSVNSLSFDVLHKISQKNNLVVNGVKMDAMQFFLDMHLNPEFWKNQKIIKINNPYLSNILGVSGKYASFNDFFDKNYYKLEELAQNAFQKEASKLTKTDKEIIKLTDRVNVFMMCINSSFLKIFPVQKAVNNKWISWTDSLASLPLSGEILHINKDLKLNEFNYNNIMRAYLVSTIYARESGDYTIPDKIIEDIKTIQRELSPVDLLPSENKIKLEVFYNNYRIFDVLKYLYVFFGISLLILAFINDFSIKQNKKLLTLIKVIAILIFVSFISQTFGMILRWYLSGHAPWSNGYEVLLLASWSSVFAGVFIYKKSKISFASTSLLSALLLMIAGMSYYDPQLTNLIPILKSYWLIIHVGVITIGYSFLSLSFILALINLSIVILSSKNKLKISSLVFEELSFVNEKILIIGLLLSAIGTFLGGVWANESWGRYWGWDAKEAWSLIIILAYAIVLHLKYIPKMKSLLIFNIATIISYFSVIMTFVGVNYYFKKGLHTYASGTTFVFPIWAWLILIMIVFLIIIAVIKSVYQNKKEIKGV